MWKAARCYPEHRRTEGLPQPGCLKAADATGENAVARKDTRTETDSMGPVEVPAEALWGAQTQRAIANFDIGGRPLPPAFIQAVCRIKAAAAEVNVDLGLLDGPRGRAIAAAADSVVAGQYAEQFPVDVYQTGSGTSTNMNVNEVLARLATASCDLDVSPNDHVNLGQSSNDVIPAAIHVAATLAIAAGLNPAWTALCEVLARRSHELSDVVKTGRTHLMDAMPLTLGQELSAWAAPAADLPDRLAGIQPRLARLALGGTAVGTGINTHAEFGTRIAARLSSSTGVEFRADDNRFRAIASQDTAAELAAVLRSGALTLIKIANDLRWMNSGPLAGLAEIQLEPLQPGSSIMPGKVNPVLPEAVAMAAARIIGLDATVATAAGSGNFQLNVMLPVIADSLLEAIGLLAGSARATARSVGHFEVRHQRLADPLARNPILVTALNSRLGYLRAAEIAKQAYQEGRPILDVAADMTDLPRGELEALLDPKALTEGGLPD
ncbi:MAG: class II fumarate hydratase [Gammaproteobacteria bacterium]|nr:class II fumarate hydratase [Gammaproteobacteria bacterium]